jgi:hypothetical protein
MGAGTGPAVTGTTQASPALVSQPGCVYAGAAAGCDGGPGWRIGQAGDVQSGKFAGVLSLGRDGDI